MDYTDFYTLDMMYTFSSTEVTVEEITIGLNTTVLNKSVGFCFEET